MFRESTNSTERHQLMPAPDGGRAISMESNMDDMQRQSDYEHGWLDGYNRGTRLMRWASVAVGAGWGIAIWYLIELAGRAWR